MTDRAEIQRVVEIHAALDKAHLYMAPNSTHYTVAPHRDASIVYTYTRAEIKAWPETKVKMVSVLIEHVIYPLAFLSTYQIHPVQLGYQGAIDCGAKDAIARGLVMYREQLSGSVPPVPPAGGKWIPKTGDLVIHVDRADSVATVTGQNPMARFAGALMVHFDGDPEPIPALANNLRPYQPAAEPELCCNCGKPNATHTPPVDGLKSCAVKAESEPQPAAVAQQVREAGPLPGVWIKVPSPTRSLPARSEQQRGMLRMDLDTTTEERTRRLLAPIPVGRNFELKGWR